MAPSLEELEERLRKARERAGGKHKHGSGPARSGGGMGLAIRVVSELVAAVAVGTGMGYVLDRWLGTGPWLLLVFVILGFCAGVVTLIRTAKEIERKKAQEQG